MKRVVPVLSLVSLLILAAFVPVFAEDAVIGAGDTIKVTVLGEDQLTRQVVVDPAGRAVLPLIGEITVSGITPMRAAEAIKQGFTKFLKRPDVTVEVIEKAKRIVVVTGAVKTPGQCQIEPGARLADAIALAGGSLPGADLSKISVIRSRDKSTSSFDLATFKTTANDALNPELESGDMVNVPEMNPVQGEVLMMGELTQRGAIPLRQGMTIRDAIGTAGGLTANADTSNVTLKRVGESASVPIDLAKAMAGDPAVNVTLNNGDSINVGTIQQLGTFSVVGAVNNQNTFPLRGKVTLTEAIAQAGGFTREAKATVKVTSANGTSQVYDIHRQVNVAINPGDTIFVEHRKQKLDPFRILTVGASLLYAITR